MKDYTGEEFEAAPRPTVATVHAVEFCLQRLYADRLHVSEDEVSPGLSYRELIAAMILSRDLIGSPSDDGTDVDDADEIDSFVIGA